MNIFSKLPIMAEEAKIEGEGTDLNSNGQPNEGNGGDQKPE